MSRRRVPFTPAEDAILIAHAGKVRTAQIAAQLGRDVSTVRVHLRVLRRRGLVTWKYHRPWSHEDDEVLREEWGLVEPIRLAHQFGRTVTAVIERAARLGIRQRDAFLSCRMVARELGVSDPYVLNWIRRGWLKATRSHLHAGSRGRVWRIEEHDLEAALRRRPWLADYRRMPTGYWHNVAKAAAQATPYVTAPEAARLIGMKHGTLLRRIHAGAIAAEWGGTKSHGKGGCHWIKRSDLLAFMAEREAVAA